MTHLIKSKHDIAFCITSRNRLWQLSQTLKANLSKLGDGQIISLVDYGSSDGLSGWIWKNFEQDIKNGKLSFFEVSNKVSWNLARAKNLSHRLADAKYLFNLDADNSIDEKDILMISKAAKEQKVVHQFSGNFNDGSCGRIGLTKELFERIGGYDESLLSMSVQDVDLLRRILSLKIKIFKITPPSIIAIQNSFADKMVNISNDQVDPKKSYIILNRLNQAISKIKLENEGAIRLGGFSSYEGLLNGEKVRIDGFNNIALLKL